MASVNFSVQAYDSDHESALLNGPRSATIRQLIKSGLTVSDSEILISTMFTEQDPNRIGFRSYHELAERVISREEVFRDYIKIDNNDIFAVGSQNSTQKSQTERLGVACSILAINNIIGITEADWERIEETNKNKTLDYQLNAATGSSIIGVESKGTLADEPHKKSSGSISGMKGGIEAKKKAARKLHGSGVHEDYGVITAIARKSGVAPRIFLLDPPGDGSDLNPQKQRILNRLKYYKHQLSYISKFGMLTVLENRIKGIEDVTNYAELNGRALLGIGGEPIALSKNYYGRPLIEVNGFIGRCYYHELFKRGSGWRFPFIGFDRNIFDSLVSQRFERINELKWEAGRKFSKRISFWVNDGGKNQLSMSGELTCGVNSAGMAYGWVQIN